MRVTLWPRVVGLCVSLSGAVVISGCCCAFPLSLADLLGDDDDDDSAQEDDEGSPWAEFDDDDGPKKTPRKTPKPPPKKRRRTAGRSGRVDLGVAGVPAGTEQPRATHHWTSIRTKPSRYGLEYRLATTRAATVRQDYLNYARRVGHRRVDESRFQWAPPRGCHVGLHCVYQQLDRQGRDEMAPIIERFRARAKRDGLNTLQIAKIVIAFGQHIHYRIPKKEPFGILPPGLVVAERWGDCDSKALVVAMILRELNIDVVLISSRAHKHTMLGVGLPSGGASFRFRSRRYAFVEMTAKHSPIGHIKRTLLHPNDWQATALGPPNSKGALAAKLSTTQTKMSGMIRID